MKLSSKQILLVLSLLLMALGLNAQIANDLQIYTDTEGPFTLYVNGVKINKEPALSVTAVNLHQDYVSVKIVLNDGKTKFQQSIGIKDFSSPTPVILVMLLKRKKNGKLKLAYRGHSDKKVQTGTINLHLQPASD